MTPVPADMLMFFIIRMDIPMITNMLDEATEYAGMSFNAFIAYLEKGFEKHTALGDATILALQGKFGNPARVGYSFKGNKSLAHFPLVLVANEDKMIIDMHIDAHFEFNANNFVIKK